ARPRPPTFASPSPLGEPARSATASAWASAPLRLTGLSSLPPMSTLAIDDLGRDLAMMARLVQTQLGAAMTAFFERDVGLAERVKEGDDRVDTPLGLIEEKCFRRIGTAGLDPDSLGARQLHGVFRVAINLEKLGDYAVNVAEQAVHVSRLPAW